MSKDLRKAHEDLKARLVAANQRVLALRRKMTQAEQEASALQRALDALETATAGMPKEETESVGRRSTRGRDGIQRIVDALQSNGPMTAPKLAEALGASYWSTITRLKRGPFEVTGSVKSGRRTVQVWSVAAEAVPVGVAAEPEAEGN